MLLKRKISIIYFIKQIKWQILSVVIFALAIGFTHRNTEFSHIQIPLSVLALVGTIVSILLAFRTSQSYERWWEARIVWGAIVNDSRSFVREIMQYVKKENVSEVNLFAERQIIWVNALGESLRKVPFSSKVAAYLEQNNLKDVNIPNSILTEHSKQIKDLVENGKISEFSQLQLNQTLSKLCDSMGKCERIKNTVFPRSYSLMLHTLIYAFTVILPFGLDHSQLTIEIILSILIPIMFISIEKTAIIMQDPFENSPADTPMTSIAQTIEINIRQMIGDENIPVKVDAGLYYEM
ncbi:bestrophin family ion channel [Elizabethkingia sp. HX QKY]|uniref:bestrophin family protein n=1 Tax=Elizabethkingia TaxID=308865 RepID=UPI002A242B65|nr:bestrophin family ion channel [Elizabethkingia sp. HX QKY]MDX8572233.1 bestrophin family ion channel [Elizabethkingia sp. HX QKY]